MSSSSQPHRCGEIRLLGIDTPDDRDSPPCRGHFGDHVCDDKAAKAAKRSLIAIVSRNRSAVRLEPVTHDRYGRTVAKAWAGGVELTQPPSLKPRRLLDAHSPSNSALRRKLFDFPEQPLLRTPEH